MSRCTVQGLLRPGGRVGSRGGRWCAGARSGWSRSADRRGGRGRASPRRRRAAVMRWWSERAAARLGSLVVAAVGPGGDVVELGVGGPSAAAGNLQWTSRARTCVRRARRQCVVGGRRAQGAGCGRCRGRTGAAAVTRPNRRPGQRPWSSRVPDTGSVTSRRHTPSAAAGGGFGDAGRVGGGPGLGSSRDDDLDQRLAGGHRPESGGPVGACRRPASPGIAGALDLGAGLALGLALTSARVRPWRRRCRLVAGVR